MNLPITGAPCWTPPPGIYRGFVEEAGSYKLNPKKVRIVFSLEHEDGSGREFKVHRFYGAKLHPGTALHHDIEQLIGEGHLKRGKQFALESIVRCEAFVRVVHQDLGKPEPFVTYDQIYRIPDEETIPETTEVKEWHAERDPIVRGLTSHNERNSSLVTTSK
jgi:hypothetical protein